MNAIPQKKPANKLLLTGIILVSLLVCCAVTLTGGWAYYWYVYQPVSPTAPVTLPGSSPTEAAAPMPAVTATPAQATQTSPAPVTSNNTFNENGLGFAFDPQMFADFSAENIPATFGNDLPAWEQLPEHRKIPVGKYPLANTFHEPVIYIFPVSEYISVNAIAGEQIAALNLILRERNTSGLSKGLPFFPGWNAAQVMTSQVEFIDFKNGSGIRYITQYDQAMYPINNNELFYTFQGLTSDNQFLISAIMPISNPILPDPETAMQNQDFINNFQGYLNDTTNLLNSQPPDSFTPNMHSLDALFASMEVK